MDIVETLKKAGIIPVIVIEDAAKAVPLARALVKGGLPVLEVTFRTAAAAESIAAIKAEVPEAVVGAGTLLTPEMVKAAVAAGAAFGVAPGFDPAVVAAAKEAGLPFVPGIATASELSQALTAGSKMVKFFPAEAAGGVKMIKNLLGAFRFTGTTNCWKVTQASVRELARVEFANPTKDTFTGLKTLNVTFSDKPTKALYYLTTATVDGLTEADLKGTAVTVTDGEHDYSANFALTVRNGRLALANSKPGGIVVIVR